MSLMVFNISVNFSGKALLKNVNKVETVIELVVLSVTDLGIVLDENSKNTQPPTEEIHHEIVWFFTEQSLALFKDYDLHFSVIEKFNLPGKIYQEVLLPPPLF
ncbi:MAG: hypothetical protein HND27_07465 [Bacteroidetes bacterium]|nr:hypothetical protein [Flavobacteriales bacterium]MCL4816696.1 hypothetical protein [Flavobacteriales bacterium]NOG95602.1 hypothetical protein [Bacteroidota bacterium]CAG0971753.1 hypothetical protein FLAV_01278 [Flavobacteriales bacterium]